MSIDKILFQISDKMPGVVDPALRMRLSTEYLNLLQRWKHFPRKNGMAKVPESFAAAVGNLAVKVDGGQVAYKYTPALGVINDAFYKLYQDAMGSINRLSDLAEAQTDLAIQRRWKGELQDLATKLDHYKTQLEASSTNANLSQVDAITSQVGQYLAGQLIPREVEWSRILKVSAPRFRSRGTSGVVARQAYPDKWYPSNKNYPSLPAMGQSIKGKKIPNTSYVTQPEGLGGVWDDIKNFATGAWEGGKNEAEMNADQTYAKFKTSLTRAKGIGERHNAHETAIVAFRSEDPERAAELQKNLEERKVMLANAKIQLRDVGDSLTRTSFYTWDEPQNMVATHLGGLDTTKRGIVLLYSDEINTASAALDDIEKRDDAFEAEIQGSLSTPEKVAIAGGSGLALLGVGALALMLLRKK